jgi:MFS transporter, DHA2 family, multidrug resistance protein
MVAFTTLPAALRNEGTSFFNLLRNVGSSVGISVVTFLLTQNTQRMHASLTEHITLFNMASNPAAAHIDVASTRSLLALNGMITNQSAMIGYIDDFKLMMVLTIVTIPFLLMIRNVKPASGETPVVAE